MRPGDELRIESEILEARPSKSYPDQGLIKVCATTIKQMDEPVQVQIGKRLVPRNMYAMTEREVRA
jgi:acyl dehydratase